MKEEGKETRLIVRIANKDLNGKLPIYRALIHLKGINHRIGRVLAYKFEEETKIPFDSRLGEIPEEKDKILEEIVSNPNKYAVPVWMMNKQKEFESGENKHYIMGDLDFEKRKDIQRLGKIKSYRGLRLEWGLPVRGQKTKSTHRGKGGAIGVIKKEARIAQAKGGAAPEKKEKSK